MRHYDFPISPVILGVILGQMMDVQFRRTLVISNGDLSVFVTRPLTAVLLSSPWSPCCCRTCHGSSRACAGRTAARLAFGEDD